MKNSLIKCTAVIIAVLMLISCGKKGSGSSQSTSASPASADSSDIKGKDKSKEQSSSNGKNKPASDDEGKPMSQKAPIASAPPVSSDTESTEIGPACFVTMQPQGEKGYVLLEIKVPTGWNFDSYTVFSCGEYKTGEVISVTRSKSDALPQAITSKYNVTTDSMADGLGLISGKELTIGDAKAMLYTFKTQPHDADKPWFNYYYIMQCTDYVLEIGFFSEKEAELSVYEEILKSIIIHV